MSIEGCLGALIRLLIIGPFFAFLDLARGARFRPHPLTASFADDLVDAHVLGPDEEMGADAAVQVARSCLEGVSGRRRLPERQARALIERYVRETAGLEGCYTSPFGLRNAARGLCTRVALDERL